MHGEGDSLQTLVERDLMRLAGDGEVAVAYPFSAQPTRHRVQRRDGRTITVSIDPGTQALRWSSADAVVVAASSGAGCSSACACPQINLFASREAAGCYLDRPELEGKLLGVPEAIHAGRRLFGDLLDRLARLEVH